MKAKRCLSWRGENGNFIGMRNWSPMMRLFERFSLQIFLFSHRQRCTIFSGTFHPIPAVSAAQQWKHFHFPRFTSSLKIEIACLLAPANQVSSTAMIMVSALSSRSRRCHEKLSAIRTRIGCRLFCDRAICNYFHSQSHLMDGLSNFLRFSSSKQKKLWCREIITIVKCASRCLRSLQTVFVIVYYPETFWSFQLNHERIQPVSLLID